MNARQISNLIPDIVAARATSPTDRWSLVILDEKIQCIPMEDLGSQGYPLMPITMAHVDKGFNGRDWDRIINRIEVYQRNHPDFYAEPKQIAAQKCEKCGCTENDCQECIDARGYACVWVAPNKCDRCFTKSGNLKRKKPDETETTPNSK